MSAYPQAPGDTKKTEQESESDKDMMWLVMQDGSCRAVCRLFTIQELKAFYKAVYKRGAAGQRRAEEGTQD